ncbi:MAG TPA: group II intron reverse transcriptase/maturase [Gemmatimonadota bacterium]|nr:group II intron reverse transcriptase/maturase [Gemmatimonadota bacterium]
MTTLAHHIDIELLRQAFARTRKDGAAGIDGQTAEGYARELDENLRGLLDRFKSGTYRAPPVKRAHIPKGDGSTRPIGIPTFEDKLLQRAVAMVLEAVYEQDFRDCSYGFRPGRSAHQALQVLWDGAMAMNGGWLVEVDIRGFFDALVHRHLRSILDGRVRDGVIRRMIDKWLKAGVLENGSIVYPEDGTPQGGVVSPLLANVYLHHVLDVWFEDEVRPRLGGRSLLVRYADDFVIVFEHEVDARRVFEVLPKRFGKYGLELHREKTRLVPFRRPLLSSVGRGKDAGGLRPGTFDFLGFTHVWSRSLQGNWYIRRRTAKGRFKRAVAKLADWCRRARHWKVRDQHASLCRKLRGHDAYYGIAGNAPKLRALRKRLERIWLRNLRRRSQRRNLSWRDFWRLLERYPLPEPKVMHAVSARGASP